MRKVSPKPKASKSALERAIGQLDGPGRLRVCEALELEGIGFVPYKPLPKNPTTQSMMLGLRLLLEHDGADSAIAAAWGIPRERWNVAVRRYHNAARSLNGPKSSTRKDRTDVILDLMLLLERRELHTPAARAARKRTLRTALNRALASESCTPS